MKDVITYVGIDAHKKDVARCGERLRLEALIEPGR